MKDTLMKGVFLLVKYYWENALIIGILFTGENYTAFGGQLPRRRWLTLKGG
jgi:hypothetical protein